MYTSLDYIHYVFRATHIDGVGQLVHFTRHCVYHVHLHSQLGYCFDRGCEGGPDVLVVAEYPDFHHSFSKFGPSVAFIEILEKEIVLGGQTRVRESLSDGVDLGHLNSTLVTRTLHLLIRKIK